MSYSTRLSSKESSTVVIVHLVSHKYRTNRGGTAVIIQLVSHGTKPRSNTAAVVYSMVGLVEGCTWKSLGTFGDERCR